MPQIMIDISAESAESLRLLAVLLTSYAGMKDAEAGIDRSTGLSVAATVQAATAAHTAVTPDASAIFGKNTAPVVPQGTDATNVVQLFPGAPSLPALPSVTTAAVNAPASPVVQSAADAAVVVSAELDAAGIPWDARIHQSNRNKKADNTWMLKRGLDKTLAASVLAELTVNKLPAAVTNTPAAAPAAGPVTLPPPPTGLPLPPPPVGPATGTVVLGTLPPPPNGAALPAVSNGLPPVLPATLTPVQRFSVMMVKINAARTSGQIDQNMIDEAHKALGLPQLQLAITQPDKIPLIEAALGL